MQTIEIERRRQERLSAKVTGHTPGRVQCLNFCYLEHTIPKQYEVLMWTIQDVLKQTETNIEKWARVKYATISKEVKSQLPDVL